MASPKKVVAIEVVRYPGQTIQLPTDPREMPILTAIEVLKRQHAMETTITEFTELIPAFPWDGAIALDTALKEQFGMTLSADRMPHLRAVNISATETIRIPWGSFRLMGLTTSPGNEAIVHCGMNKDEQGNPCFEMTVEALMKDQPIVERLFARVRELALATSIYRGKSLDFSQGGGVEGLPKLTFKTLPATKAIFSKAIEDAIERNVLVPIWYIDACRRAGIPLKRGILLGGEYGGGKTLVISNILTEANKNGWTGIEVTDPHEIASAIAFARRMGPTVLVVEDIDRVIGPDRTDEVNEIINMIDGPATKDMELIMLFTSNHPERINKAMRRDGRIDKTFEIKAPDADAVRRLIIQFGSATIDPRTTAADLMVVGGILEGNRPSKIRETVERSKLEALRRTDGTNALITGKDLEATADEVLEEAKLYEPLEEKFHPMERVGMGLAHGIGNGLTKGLDRIGAHTNGAA